MAQNRNFRLARSALPSEKGVVDNVEQQKRQTEGKQYLTILKERTPVRDAVACNGGA
jgi:hypothetical protein